MKQHPNPLMEYVKLLTSRGEFVVTGELPAYNPQPDVLVWGDRVFKRGIAESVYYECFATAITQWREEDLSKK